MRLAPAPFQVLTGGKHKGKGGKPSRTKKLSEQGTQRWSEDTAFPLIEAFKAEHPQGTDKELMLFMHANAESTARHWRKRYEEQQRSAAG